MVCIIKDLPFSTLESSNTSSKRFEDFYSPWCIGNMFSASYAVYLFVSLSLFSILYSLFAFLFALFSFPLSLFSFPFCLLSFLFFSFLFFSFPPFLFSSFFHFSFSLFLFFSFSLFLFSSYPLILLSSFLFLKFPLYFGPDELIYSNGGKLDPLQWSTVDNIDIKSIKIQKMWSFFQKCFVENCRHIQTESGGCSMTK